MRPSDPAPTTHTRRNLLRALAAAPMAAPVLIAGRASAASAAGPDLALAAATMGLISTNVCSVMPETTEGPYYLDPKLVRQDITEGKAGIALRLQLQVVTADCRPVSGARVDIWQCDAQGDYSGYSAMGSDADKDTTGQTFLRGTQSSDDNGIVTFDTIYPGWYRGRTTHIHYKVFLDDRTVLTSQIFFPDALSEYIYLNAPDYRRDGQRDTVNRSDGIADQAGEVPIVPYVSKNSATLPRWWSGSIPVLKAVRACSAAQLRAKVLARRQSRQLATDSAPIPSNQIRPGTCCPGLDPRCRMHGQGWARRDAVA